MNSRDWGNFKRKTVWILRERLVEIYIKHLADVSILSGWFGELNGASARGIIGNEAKRVECCWSILLVFLRSFSNDCGCSSLSTIIIITDGGSGDFVLYRVIWWWIWRRRRTRGGGGRGGWEIQWREERESHLFGFRGGERERSFQTQPTPLVLALLNLLFSKFGFLYIFTLNLLY